MIRPFRGRRGGAQVIAASTTSASVSVDPRAKSVRIVNTSGQIAHVRIGTGAQTATVNDTPMLTATSLILDKGDGEDTVAVRLAASTGNVFVEDGDGGI